MTAAWDSAPCVGVPRRATRRPITSRMLIGRPDVRRSWLATQRPLLVLIDRPRLGEVPDHLTDEERVAVGLGQQRIAQRDTLFGHLVAGRRLEQREELVVSEAAQREPLDARLPVQRRESLGERVVGAEVGVAEGRRPRAAEAERPPTRRDAGAGPSGGPPSAGRRARARAAPSPTCEPAGRRPRRTAGTAPTRRRSTRCARRSRGGRAPARAAPARCPEHRRAPRAGPSGA